MAAKTTSPKMTDAEKVSEFMRLLEHPLKPEIEAVRAIIKSTDARISERIKWNAPSYYFKDDMVTFHVRPEKHVHLVFHHPAIVTIESWLLEGDYKDRRMAYFTDMTDIENKTVELKRILGKLIQLIDN